MAITLVEAAKLSQDVLRRGVIETIIYESPMLQRLPFIELVGNALVYNEEHSLGNIDFYNPNENWNESTGDFTQRTAGLKIMGGDADVDNFLKSTRSNIQDLKAAIIALKSKAIRNKFEYTAIYGNATTRPKEFDGLAKLIDTATASDHVLAAGAAGATLTLVMLDQLMDMVKPGKPDMLLMSRRSRRKITALARASSTSGLITSDVDSFGNPIERWAGVQIGINDWILDTHTVAGSVETLYTGSTCSTIYAIKFGENALCGLQNGGSVQVEDLGKLETKDGERTRIKWYCGLASFNAWSRAALIGVQD